MASLTMEPKDWENLRKVLQRVPEGKRDDRWKKAFGNVETVKDKIRLNASEWAELRRILNEVGPQGKRDRNWRKAFDDIDFVCENILDARDMIKDPRSLEDEGEEPHRDAAGHWP